MSDKFKDNRMIFTDQLEAGMVILEQCSGSEFCQSSSHDVRKVHEYSVLDMRNSGEYITAIVMDEDGNQLPWKALKTLPVRILLVMTEESSVESLEGPGER